MILLKIQHIFMRKKNDEKRLASSNIYLYSKMPPMYSNQCIQYTFSIEYNGLKFYTWEDSYTLSSTQAWKSIMCGEKSMHTHTSHIYAPYRLAEMAPVAVCFYGYYNSIANRPEHGVLACVLCLWLESWLRGTAYVYLCFYVWVRQREKEHIQSKFAACLIKNPERARGRARAK